MIDQCIYAGPGPPRAIIPAAFSSKIVAKPVAKNLFSSGKSECP